MQASQGEQGRLTEQGGVPLGHRRFLDVVPKTVESGPSPTQPCLIDPALEEEKPPRGEAAGRKGPRPAPPLSAPSGGAPCEGRRRAAWLGQHSGKSTHKALRLALPPARSICHSLRSALPQNVSEGVNTRSHHYPMPSVILSPFQHPLTYSGVSPLPHC